MIFGEEVASCCMRLPEMKMGDGEVIKEEKMIVASKEVG